jgi:hypothetical protein
MNTPTTGAIRPTLTRCDDTPPETAARLSRACGRLEAEVKALHGEAERLLGQAHHDMGAAGGLYSLLEADLFNAAMLLASARRAALAVAELDTQRTNDAADDDGAHDPSQVRVNSLQSLLRFVRLHRHSGGARVIATVLCSLYNGVRCKVDLTDLRLLDQANFEHVINVLRLDHVPVCEVHQYFENGGEIWEQMFADYGFDQGGHDHE